VEENRRDAHQIDIMKAALQAKRRYIVATARADGSEAVAEELEAPTPTAPGAGRPSITALPRAGGAAGASSAFSSAGTRPAAPAAGAAAPAPGPGASAGRSAPGAEGWDSDDSGSVAVPEQQAAAGSAFDAAGPLPAGWTAHKDEEGDTW
jgi:hypothetical protein